MASAKGFDRQESPCTVFWAWILIGFEQVQAMFGSLLNFLFTSKKLYADWKIRKRPANNRPSGGTTR